MNLSLGIVGLPNVGKSTLFNALTQLGVPAENYPFNTIDPNVGVVAVADPRLTKLAEIVKPAKITPAVVEFWDIAGLVKGAAQGEGLGNKFLATIRGVSAIVHVVRAFQNQNIHHVEESVNALRDVDLINTELILKDLESVQSKLAGLGGRVKTDAKLASSADLLNALIEHLSSSKLAIEFSYDKSNADHVELFNSLFLLTNKPVIYLVNSEDSKIAQNIELIKPKLPSWATVIGMDIKLAGEIAALSKDEQVEYMKELGLDELPMDQLTREAYKLLGLISFFTAGEQEVRAWTIQQGTKAPQAAGVIHTDFEKMFITSEIVKFPDFISTGGWIGAKDQGKVKLSGRDYTMEDGDVVLFRHNA